MYQASLKKKLEFKLNMIKSKGSKLNKIMYLEFYCFINSKVNTLLLNWNFKEKVIEMDENMRFRLQMCVLKQLEETIYER